MTRMDFTEEAQGALRFFYRKCREQSRDRWVNKPASHLRRKRNRFRVVLEREVHHFKGFEEVRCLIDLGYIEMMPMDSDKCVVSVTREGVKAMRALLSADRL